MAHSTVDSLARSQVTVRLAGERDVEALVRLAALDSAEVPVGPTILAELDGRAVAALPVFGGRAVADPFCPTAPMIEMLELRAVQLRGEGRPFSPVRSRIARLRELLRGSRAPSLP